MNREQDMIELKTLLDGHRAMLEQVIAIAARPGHSRVTQRILDAKAIEAQRYLRRIEATLKRPVLHPTHGDLGTWGDNGLAPTIRDLLWSAQFQADYDAKDLAA